MMQSMTVSELRDALDTLREQDAPVVFNTTAGELLPYVIDTGEARVLAASWDHHRGIYLIHTSR